ncbi:hypothetical protein PZB74_21975 [Porifericola rhodea]|uniref:hypothetical protein n=1 Tax=Porifericola rhodea TaxID=930972 RepID=UPI002666A385|nr:hypothetical protein [Porifericola rhodea]WKN31617.1 hypothetical protein PZB74_21975 [Porifericola rhodea]
MPHDLLTEEAINLREILYEMESRLEAEDYAPTFANQYLLKLIDQACKACVALGETFIGKPKQAQDFLVFQQLVELQVIDAALSKRLLSMIAFRKLSQQAARIQGKNIKLRFTPRHLEDFRTFTQNLLLA